MSTSAPVPAPAPALLLGLNHDGGPGRQKPAEIPRLQVDRRGLMEDANADQEPDGNLATIFQKMLKI